MGTKCEDGHPLTPYRVTFSTEDAAKSPAVGLTPATGGTSLSPLRSPGGARSDTEAAASAAAAGSRMGPGVASAVNGGGGGEGGGGGANATESPGARLSDNDGDGSGRQQQQQAPRMRDSRGGGDQSGVGGGVDGGGGVVVSMDESEGSVGAAANPAGLGRVSAPSSLPSLPPSNSTAEGVLRETERRTREADGGRRPGALAQGVEDGECAVVQMAPRVDVGGGEGQTATVAVVAAAAEGAVAGEKGP